MRFGVGDGVSRQAGGKLAKTQFTAGALTLSLKSAVASRQQQTRSVVQPFAHQFCQEDLIALGVGSVLEPGKHLEARFLNFARSMGPGAIFKVKDISQP